MIVQFRSVCLSITDRQKFTEGDSANRLPIAHTYVHTQIYLYIVGFYLFWHPSWTGSPVHLDLLAQQHPLIHGGQSRVGRDVVLELHEAVGVIARFSDDLAALHGSNLVEDGQDEVFSDPIVKITNIQSLGGSVLINGPIHPVCFTLFCYDF